MMTSRVTQPVCYISLLYINTKACMLKHVFFVLYTIQFNSKTII